MKPDFKIIAGSEDITEKIRDRLLSLRVIDRTGVLSDRLEITLDDRDHEIELPATGVELEVFLGYTETGLTRMGKFTVDEVELSGPPNKMTIRAQAFDSKKSLKESKSRSWDGVALGDLLTAIATEHELTAKVGAEFQSIAIAHLDQTDESDIHLLTRLAREYGAIAKPAGGFLLFVKQGEARSVSGQDLPLIDITPPDATTWRVTLAERNKYKSVSAFYHDTASAERQKIQIGEGRPAKSLRYSYPNEEEARRAAQAKLESLNRGASKLSITLPGNPVLSAEVKLNLTSFRERANGKWLISRVEHTLDNSGYRCQLDGEVPR